MKAHDNAWLLFDYLSTNPLKTDGCNEHYSWVKDKGKALIWPNRIYRLALDLPEYIVSEIADNVRQGVYPREVQLRLTKENKSNLNALIAAGFCALREFPAMSVSYPDKRIPFHFPDDWSVRLKEISTTQQLQDWSALLGTGFWKDHPDVAEPLYQLYAPIYQNNPCLKLYVCYVNSIPVATSMAFISKSVGGIYLVYVLDSYRKHGLGALMAQTALEGCTANGAKRIILQATPLGEPVYKRMGFKQDFKYIILVPAI